jgi:hypothetical protein
MELIRIPNTGNSDKSLEFRRFGRAGRPDGSSAGPPGTRYDPAMSTQGARKTSGTHSMWDTLTHPGTIGKVLMRKPTGDPADDLVSLGQGVPLRTSALRLGEEPPDRVRR